MKRLSLLILCACLANAAGAAGGKSGVKGAKTGAVLSAAPTTVPAQTASGGGSAVLGAGVAAGAVYANPRYVPPMDPARDVSEQDCTKPVDLARGNLKCK